MEQHSPDLQSLNFSVNLSPESSSAPELISSENMEKIMASLAALEKGQQTSQEKLSKLIEEKAKIHDAKVDSLREDMNKQFTDVQNTCTNLDVKVKSMEIKSSHIEKRMEALERESKKKI